ncbi:MAG: tetratricopeptide repeat protein [Candidatus Hydrogenedentes bacterium]|nr:tetratricopeptide repeat protein [Candidatus Hydrogenedentota bacterium]
MTRGVGILFTVCGALLLAAPMPNAQDTPVTAQSPAEIARSLQSAFEANPRSYDALAAYVHFLNRQGRTDDATLVLRSANAIGADPGLLWAETQWYAGDAEGARSRLESFKTDEAATQCAALELQLRVEYLDGKADAAEVCCRRLLALDPVSKAARVFLSNLLVRRGRYDEALALLDAAEAAYPGDIIVAECRAELLEAQGNSDEAAQLRRSAIESLIPHPPDSVDGLVAAASLLGQAGEPRAANECLQTAMRFAPADPFLAIEKIRLHRRVHDMVVAAVTARDLLTRYTRCPLALAEFADALWELRHDAQQTENLCQQAVGMDPTLLNARCRLIMLCLSASDWAAAEKLIEENRAINPEHLETENLAAALAVLKSGQPSEPLGTGAPGAQAAARMSIVGEILAARGSYARSVEWFARSLAADPENPRVLKAAGLARLRCAQFDEATPLLESAFNGNRYDVTLKNVLDFLDAFHASSTVNDGEITVGFQHGDELTAEYCLFLSQRYVKETAERLHVAVEGPLRVQLCASRDDINVLTEGIPPSCACGSQPQGSIYVDSTVFVWSPRTMRGSESVFRFDEALHRGIIEHVLEKGIGPGIPHWMREGLAHYTGSLACPEWQAPLAEPLAGFLQSGGAFPLDRIESIFVANRNPLCRPYAGLVVKHWVERYGLDSVLGLLSRVSGGESWIAAAEAQFGSPLDALDAEARAEILQRFAALRIDRPVNVTPGALASLVTQSDAAAIEGARMYLARQRYEDAERSLAPLLAQESPKAEALLLSGRAAFGRGDYAAAKERIGLGLEVESLYNATVATDKDFEVLGLSLVKLGESDEAVEAFRKSIALNPFDATENGPYGQLLTLLGENKSPEYYAVLEQRLPVRRADPRPRLELARWYEAQGNPEKALQHLESAAGMRPDWIEVHRELAALAMRLGKTDLAYASLRVLHRKLPEDVRVLGQLTECARILDRVQETEEFAERVNFRGDETPTDTTSTPNP